MRLRVTTRHVPDPRPLLQLLPELPDDRRNAFVRDGDGLVSWGVTARLDAGSDPDRFTRADAWFRELVAGAEVNDHVQRPGTGAVAIGSFDFDGGSRGSVLIVPRVVVGRRDGATWRTDIVDIDATGGATETDADRPPAAVRPDPSRGSRPRFAGSSIPDAAWLTAVDEAVALIRTGDLEKVVLARDQVLWARSPFDTTGLLARLAGRFPSCTTFLVDRLIGASPELLVAREGPEIRSVVLAGTAPRDPDGARDAELGAALLRSGKDRDEHEFAVRSVVDALATACTGVRADGPDLLRLDNVQHLATTIMATGTEGLRSLDLVASLHPTAAVGGVPRAGALATIRRLEGIDRDRYAAPVGWTDARGDGEWAVALRCALVEGDRARLFAGAGIVAESLPEAELLETWHKLGAMRGALGAGHQAV